jgi:altronate dehydratase small subunit
MGIRALIINEKDSVAVMLNDIKAGEVADARLDDQMRPVTARQDVPFGHKIAITAIRRGEKVIKYGEPIGLATQDIQPGEHVHIHNIESTRGRGDLKQGQARVGEVR